MQEERRVRPRPRQSSRRVDPWFGARRASDLLAVGALLVLFGALLLPDWDGAALGQAAAWVSGLAVVAALFAYPRSRLPGHSHLARDLERELAFVVASSTTRGEARALRRSPEAWHGRHGHSGERPRFD